MGLVLREQQDVLDLDRPEKKSFGEDCTLPPHNTITIFSKWISRHTMYQNPDPEVAIFLFNQWFKTYARDHKLDSEWLIRNRSISCTGASILLGVWAEMRAKLTPEFLVLSDRHGSHIDFPHTIVFLHQFWLENLPASLQLRYDDNDLRNGQFVEYRKAAGLTMFDSDTFITRNKPHIRIIGTNHYAHYMTKVIAPKYQ